MKSTIAAPARPLPEKNLDPKSVTDQPAPVDQQVASALLELDLEVARRQSRRVGRLASVNAQSAELAASKRADRSTLDEIAASLGVSRSTANAMFDEPPVRGGGGKAPRGGGGHLRHAHGVGRRRHAGAGASRGGSFRG